jgi:ribosomal protein S4
MRLRSDNINVSNKKIDIPSTAVTNAIMENIVNKINIDIIIKINIY